LRETNETYTERVKRDVGLKETLEAYKERVKERYLFERDKRDV